MVGVEKLPLRQPTPEVKTVSMTKDDQKLTASTCKDQKKSQIN